MSENSGIEWTDHTHNPWIGCTQISPGCLNCYAEIRMDKRLHKVQWGAGQSRIRTSAANWREPLKWNARHDEFFAVHGRRQRVFCASLADVFDNEVDPSWRDDLFQLIQQTPNLDWLLLTKRIGNVTSMLDDVASRLPQLQGADGKYTPMPNVWIGATIVNQEEADRDIPKLLEVPAEIRFLSMEPLLGLVDLPGMLFYGTERTGGVVPLREKGYKQIDWVIAGAESTVAARPMHPDWVRSLRDQCEWAKVPFLFKQWGEWLPAHELQHAGLEEKDIHGKEGLDLEPNGAIHWAGNTKGAETKSVTMYKVGKRNSGRLLDGKLHDDYPSRE